MMASPLVALRQGSHITVQNFRPSIISCAKITVKNILLIFYTISTKKLPPGQAKLSHPGIKLLTHCLHIGP